MGANHSGSYAEQIVTNKLVNENDLKSIVEQSTNASTENIMKSVMNSAAASSQSAAINIGMIRATGPNSVVSGIRGMINQESTVTLDVLQKSIQNNEINTEMATQIVSNVTAEVTNDQMTKLVSQASSDQSVAGLALTGGNSSDAIVINNMSSDIKNKVSREFVSIVNNVITQRAESLDYKTCIANDMKSAQINIAGIEATKGGRVENIELTINQVSNVLNKCIMNTVQSAKVMTAIANAMGITVKDETTNKQTSEGEATATAKQTITSMFDMGSIISMVLCIICIIILIVLYKAVK